MDEMIIKQIKTIYSGRTPENRQNITKPEIKTIKKDKQKTNSKFFKGVIEKLDIRPR